MATHTKARYIKELLHHVGPRVLPQKTVRVILTIRDNVIGLNCDSTSCNHSHDWLLCIYCSYASYLYELRKMFS